MPRSHHTHNRESHMARVRRTEHRHNVSIKDDDWDDLKAHIARESGRRGRMLSLSEWIRGAIRQQVLADVRAAKRQRAKLAVPA